jgi:hypothetical protein
MTIQDRFFEYADAFEVSYVDDDWSRLAQYFTEDASYDSGDGKPAAGREAVLQKLADAVNGMDRLMGNREVSFQAHTIEGNTVIIPWTGRYTTDGLPALEIEGVEFARFEGERIAELRDELKPESIQAIGAWMGAHGDKLSP